MTNKNFIDRVKELLTRVSMTCLDKDFFLIVEYDRKYEVKDFMFMYPRVYIQIEYSASCTKTEKIDTWKGRKWYLSEHMTDDEIIKTTYAAFEACVKHEIMEGFKIDGKILFNPHIDFEELLLITNKEIKRNI
jgi:hypothetical protein